MTVLPLTKILMVIWPCIEWQCCLVQSSFLDRLSSCRSGFITCLLLSDWRPLLLTFSSPEEKLLSCCCCPAVPPSYGLSENSQSVGSLCRNVTLVSASLVPLLLSVGTSPFAAVWLVRSLNWNSCSNVKWVLRSSFSQSGRGVWLHFTSNVSAPCLPRKEFLNFSFPFCLLPLNFIKKKTRPRLVTKLSLDSHLTFHIQSMKDSKNRLVFSFGVFFILPQSTWRASWTPLCGSWRLFAWWGRRRGRASSLPGCWGPAWLRGRSSPFWMLTVRPHTHKHRWPQCYSSSSNSRLEE